LEAVFLGVFFLTVSLDPSLVAAFFTLEAADFFAVFSAVFFVEDFGSLVALAT